MTDLKLDFSPDNIKRLLTEAVAAKPEGYTYVSPQVPQPGLYTDCYYLSYAPFEDIDEGPGEPTGGAGCIMGHMLKAMGVSDQWLRDHEGNAVSDLVRTLAREHDLNAPTDDTLIALDRIQSRQDEGKTWADALALHINDIR